LKAVPENLTEPCESSLRLDIFQVYQALLGIDAAYDKSTSEGQPPMKKLRQQVSPQSNNSGENMDAAFALLFGGTYPEGLRALEKNSR